MVTFPQNGDLSPANKNFTWCQIWSMGLFGWKIYNGLITFTFRS